MSTKPLALLIIDRHDRVRELGYPRSAEEFAAKVEQWNLSDHETGFRVVPVGEIPAWQPITTAKCNGKPLILYWPSNDEMSIASIDDQGIAYLNTGSAVHVRRLHSEGVLWLPRPAPPEPPKGTE